MRALIVDDEPLARSRLRRLLLRIGGVEICGEAADTDAAMDCIRAQAPDVVFLDIRMPGRDGLRMALEEPQLPPVIFTTAYDEFALAAFDAAAIDYLLKPIEEARLRVALGRLPSHQDRSRLLSALRELLERSPNSAVTPRVSAKRGDSVHVFEASAIDRFHAEEKYTSFVHQGQEFLSEETLNALEARLNDSGFFRCHRAELIALDAVRRLLRVGDGFEVELRDGQRARVSRRAVAELRRRLGIESS